MSKKYKYRFEILYRGERFCTEPRKMTRQEQKDELARLGAFRPDEDQCLMVSAQVEDTDWFEVDGE